MRAKTKTQRNAPNCLEWYKRLNASLQCPSIDGIYSVKSIACRQCLQKWQSPFNESNCLCFTQQQSDTRCVQWNCFFRVVSVFFPSFYSQHLFLFSGKFHERNSDSCSMCSVRTVRLSAPLGMQTEKQNFHLSPWYVWLPVLYPKTQ